MLLHGTHDHRYLRVVLRIRLRGYGPLCWWNYLRVVDCLLNVDRGGCRCAAECRCLWECQTPGRVQDGDSTCSHCAIDSTMNQQQSPIAVQACYLTLVLIASSKCLPLMLTLTLLSGHAGMMCSFYDVFEPQCLWMVSVVVVVFGLWMRDLGKILH